MKYQYLNEADNMPEKNDQEMIEQVAITFLKAWESGIWSVFEKMLDNGVHLRLPVMAKEENGTGDILISCGRLTGAADNYKPGNWPARFYNFKWALTLDVNKKVIIGQSCDSRYAVFMKIGGGKVTTFNVFPVCWDAA
ncbi:hypothetical protein CLV51_10972 [Chitinophaga niastensis]|uniref:Uncharacterized protein n=1 Tax=Chitinophaga niastensis TaxID=536980 RepID=A0A2P8HA35_CHINA|nr:hypothetical protein [Chitinophaga niastensis]PSL43078.1 hypothetical protein CLV51_10972 [Chitinophaga niastensis]